MNSPGLQQRTRCSRSHGIGSLLLVHPLSSDETRVSPLQKGTTFPKILLLIKYPYGLSFLLWPYRDVHTFPMRYVTELACEHSCPLPSNLNSVHQATGQPRYPHKFPQATGHSEITLSGHSNYPHKSSQATGHVRYPHKCSEATGQSLSAQQNTSNWTIRTRNAAPNPNAETHPRSRNRPEKAGRPGLCPVEPISSGLLYGTLRHPSSLHTV